MTTIYTIGHTKKSLEQFIGLLRAAGVDAVIDIRLRNTSQLAGFAKRDDLAFLLNEAFGIGYEHVPLLAPTPELLDNYRSDDDWAAYLGAFLPLMSERQAGQMGRQILARYQAPALLCSEASPDQCHRRLVAELWAKDMPDVEVVHLE